MNAIETIIAQNKRAAKLGVNTDGVGVNYRVVEIATSKTLAVGKLSTFGSYRAAERAGHVRIELIE